MANMQGLRRRRLDGVGFMFVHADTIHNLSLYRIIFDVKESFYNLFLEYIYIFCPLDIRKKIKVADEMLQYFSSHQ